MGSVLDILTSSHHSSKEKKKFPKELIKALDEALKKVIMRQEPAFDDVLVRSTFGAFYTYYVSDTFQKSMKENRKIEDLILMFFSRATAELQKRMSDAESKEVVMRHVAKFVRLLLQVIRTQKLAANDSDLVLRLTDYQAGLLQNAAFIARPTSSEHVSSSLPSPIDLRAKDVAMLGRLATLFNLPEESMQSLVNATIQRLPNSRCSGT